MDYPLNGELRLPTRFSEALQIAIPILEQWWPRDLLELGGGTALTTRWQHRHTTDVDLCIDVSAYRRIETEYSKSMVDSLSKLEEKGILHQFEVNRGFLEFETKYGAVSLMAIPRVLATKSQTLPDFESHTKVRFESTSETLARKLTGRIMEKGVFYLTDAYDIAVAGIHDPEALEIAKTSLSPSELATVSEEFLALSKTGRESTETLAGAVFPTIVVRAMDFARQALEGRYPERKDAERVQASDRVSDHGHDSDELELYLYGRAQKSVWPQRRSPKPIQTFDYSFAHVEMPFDPESLQLPIGTRLAGHAGKPHPEEFRRWLKDPERANQSAVKDLFEGLPGAYFIRIRRSCGGSIYELARLFHHCRIDHWIPVEWINQFSMDRSRMRGIPKYSTQWPPISLAFDDKV